MGVDIDGSWTGASAYHPRAMLGVWLYGFMTGVRSSRKLEGACRDQVPYLWLTGWQRPDHNTLWRFYKSNRQSMRKLLKATVQTALGMDLIDDAAGSGRHEGGCECQRRQDLGWGNGGC